MISLIQFTKYCPIYHKKKKCCYPPQLPPALGKPKGHPPRECSPGLQCGKTFANAIILLRGTAELTQGRGFKALKSTLDHSSCFPLLQLQIPTPSEMSLHHPVSPCCSHKKIFLLLFRDDFVFWCLNLRYLGWSSLITSLL